MFYRTRRDPGGEPGIVQHQCDVRGQSAVAGQLTDPLERAGHHLFCFDVTRRDLDQRGLEMGMISVSGISRPWGIGLTASWPPGMPRTARMAAAAAICAGSSIRGGAFRAVSRDQKAGRSSWPQAIAGTPAVSG